MLKNIDFLAKDLITEQQSDQERLRPKIQRNFHTGTQQNDDLNGQYYEQQSFNCENQEGLPMLVEYLQRNQKSQIN